TLALAETFAGEKASARTRLEQLLREHPLYPDAARVRQILASAELSVAPAAKPATFEGGPMPAPGVRPSAEPMGDVALGSLPPEFLARLPRDVDASVPAIDPEVTCALPEVMRGAEQRARQFADALERFTAREDILHEELDPA